MELSEQAQRSFLYLGDGSTDVFEAGRRDNVLVRWKFLSQIRQCHGHGALGATLVILACGSILAGLLAIANVTGSVFDFFKR